MLFSHELWSPRRHRHHELKSTNIGPPAHAEFEGLHLKFNNRKTSFIISSIYRPPGPIKASFIKEFEDLISSYNFPFIICGDFNAPASGTSIDEQLEKLIDSHRLLQHVTSPNHSKGRTHLLINSSSYDSLISNIGISEVTYSDHHLIACNISKDKPPPSIVVASEVSIGWLLNETFSASLMISCSATLMLTTSPFESTSH